MEYLQGLKLEYDQLLLEKANNVKYNVNKSRYISANKTGKQLSSFVKKTLWDYCIKDPVNNSRDNKFINQTLASFYEKLYSSEIQTDEQFL